MSVADTIWAWRHPRVHGAAGRCIGVTDLPVDRRKAKRLARRVHAAAHKAGLPRIVVTSQLARCADVGRWLRRWGWTHRIDTALGEVDFGRWEGLAWADIAVADIDAWCEDFAHHAPGGGEPLTALLQRASRWQARGARVVIGHAGWMLARRWIEEHARPPASASMWPEPPRHAQLWRLGPVHTKRDARAGGWQVLVQCSTLCGT